MHPQATMTDPRIRPTVLIAALLALSLGCAPAMTASERYRERESAHVRMVFARIDEQNRTEKKTAAWLAASYASVGIRNIRDISPQEYASYGRYVPNGDVYLIVHPGYFPYFDKWDIPRPPADYSGGYPAQNTMERVTADLPKGDVIYRSAREQEKVLRDFLEFQSLEQGLVVLILPRDYQKNTTYGQVAGYDEYARYLNELTNGAGNIVYIESDTHYSGKLRDDDLRVLLHFLKAVGARTLHLGGSFMGRCLDGFYGSLRTSMFSQDLSFVLELTAFSPTDMKADKVSLLTSAGTLSIERVENYFRKFAYMPATEQWLPWNRLSLYDLNEIR